MPLILEHESINRALAIVGLALKSDEREDSIPAQTMPVFVGWSREETLILKPEYALLSFDGIRYVRLPQPLENLRDDIQKATLPYEANTTSRYLQTSLGQWRWALEQFRNGVTTDDRDVASLRLRELQRFASKYWPGYYERVMTSISMGMVHPKADTVTRIMTVESNAVSVAVLVACGPLMGWRDDPHKSNNLTTMLDIVAYLHQGWLTVEDVRRLVSDHQWISLLKKDLASADGKLNEVRQAGFEPENVLGNRMQEMREAVCGIEDTLDELFVAELFDLAQAKIAVAMISRVITDLIEMRSRVKSALAE